MKTLQKNLKKQDVYKRQAEIIDPENYAGFDEMVSTMVELRKGKQSAEAVSYTHLDVYKRQLHDHVRKRKGWSDEQVVARWLILQCVASALLLLLVPVSYTHLDVYKRQPAGCRAAER